MLGKRSHLLTINQAKKVLRKYRVIRTVKILLLNVYQKPLGYAWIAIALYLMTINLFNLMVKLKGFTGYANVIAMAHFDNSLKIDTHKRIIWKRLRDDASSFQAHNVNILPTFLDYFSKIASTGKIKFVIQIADENDLEILDLQLKTNENSKQSVDVFPKSTNSFTYAMSTRYVLSI